MRETKETRKKEEDEQAEDFKRGKDEGGKVIRSRRLGEKQREG
jgi:hypothetical protein